MALHIWSECTRERLGEIVGEALVILSIGATEQHGPHLPTGTDALIAESLAASAAREAVKDSARELVLAPTIPVGASDHHFPFGGTLSLQAETTTAVLVDLLRSIHECGGSRALIVNGHGGNTGPCNTAAQIASTRYGMHVGYLNYWAVLPWDFPHSVGHAGTFESSLVSHLAPLLVHAPLPAQPRPVPPAVPDVVLHSEVVWRTIDGYTDQPSEADAELGSAWFTQLRDALAERIVALAGAL